MANKVEHNPTNPYQTKNNSFTRLFKSRLCNIEPTPPQRTLMTCLLEKHGLGKVSDIRRHTEAVVSEHVPNDLNHLGFNIWLGQTQESGYNSKHDEIIEEFKFTNPTHLWRGIVFDLAETGPVLILFEFSYMDVLKRVESCGTTLHHYIKKMGQTFQRYDISTATGFGKNFGYFNRGQNRHSLSFKDSSCTRLLDQALLESQQIENCRLKGLTNFQLLRLRLDSSVA